jgi:hypothetical protein
MLPEPTIPKPPPAPSALPRPWVMTPLFSLPGGNDRDANPSRPPGRRANASRPASRRSGTRVPAGRANRSRVSVTTGPREEAMDLFALDLLAVTIERLRRALWRSFLRYGIPGDLDSAVHAAINVIEPVMAARDTEILRLRTLIVAKTTRRQSASSRTTAAGR